MGVSKSPKLGLLQLSKQTTLCANLRWRWGLKQSCILRQKLFNGMWHTTCTQGNQGDSRLLVVESQIVNLTPNPFFGHNLCFKCLNRWYKPISNIYVSRAFQWYKERFNLMSFDPCNCPLKIWKSIKTPTPKVGVHLGVWGFISSHSLALPGAWNMTSMLIIGPYLRKPLPWSQAQGCDNLHLN